MRGEVVRVRVRVEAGFIVQTILLVIILLWVNKLNYGSNQIATFGFWYLK
jgi:hypothetical protein